MKSFHDKGFDVMGAYIVVVDAEFVFVTVVVTVDAAAAVQRIAS